MNGMNEEQKIHFEESLAKAERLGVHKKTTKKAFEAIQFRTRREAEEFVKLLFGWRVSDVIRQDIMGFIVWVISDSHLNFLTARGVLGSWKSLLRA